MVEAYLRGLLFLHSDKNDTPVTGVILSKIKRQHMKRFWDSSFVGSRYPPIDYVQYRHIRPGVGPFETWETWTLDETDWLHSA